MNSLLLRISRRTVCVAKRCKLLLGIGLLSLVGLTPCVGLGQMTGWGDSSSNQLSPPAGLSGVVKLSSAYYHTLALLADGSFTSWGETVGTPIGLIPLRDIATQGYVDIYLQQDGTVGVGGDSFYGESNIPSGLTVGLSSDNAALVSPTSLTFPAGVSALSISIPTTGVDASQSAHLTLTLGAAQIVLPLTVNAATTSAVTATSTVTGGLSGTAAVSLSGPAGPSGVQVGLVSDNAALRVPSSVTIPAGKSSVSFTFTTSGVDFATTAHITAGGGPSAAVTVNPASLASATATPNPVTGKYACAGIARLLGSTGPSGVTALLTSDNPSVASVPPNLKIGSGLSARSFPITTYGVSSQTTVHIQVILGSQTQTITLVVNP